MIERGGGVVVNNSSTAGLQGGVGRMAYRVSKAGVNMMTRTAALEYGGKGVPGERGPARRDPYSDPRPDGGCHAGHIGRDPGQDGRRPHRHFGGDRRGGHLAVLRRRVLRQRRPAVHRRRGRRRDASTSWRTEPWQHNSTARWPSSPEAAPVLARRRRCSSPMRVPAWSSPPGGPTPASRPCQRYATQAARPYSSAPTCRGPRT